MFGARHLSHCSALVSSVTLILHPLQVGVNNDWLEDGGDADFWLDLTGMEPELDTGDGAVALLPMLDVRFPLERLTTWVNPAELFPLTIMRSQDSTEYN